jgi:LuxR family transcriptional regulator, maltose regulon positive regulatory protein
MPGHHPRVGPPPPTAQRTSANSGEQRSRSLTPALPKGAPPPSESHTRPAITLRPGTRRYEARSLTLALDDMDEEVRATTATRVVQATLRLAHEDPGGAAAALAPILGGASPTGPRWQIQALLLKASAEDAQGDTGASARALECALELAEPGGLLLPFLLHPTPELLERHARLLTTHAALVSEILNLLSGHRPSDAAPPEEPLLESELRVLRYLPGNLRAPEIAAELFVSLNTIRTHTRNIYLKLGVHSRTDAVNRARELGLLSPSTRGR